jgi:uncharacterized integral membrane protein
MGNLWLKIKVWTKITIFSVVLIYLAIFILENADKPVTMWIWFNQELSTTLLRLVPSLLVAGVVGTLLTRTVLKTVRQWRELQAKTRAAQLEKDIASIKARAAMLQTKPVQAPAASASAGSPSSSSPPTSSSKPLT